jgi:hypothetical protein
MAFASCCNLTGLEIAQRLRNPVQRFVTSYLLMCSRLLPTRSCARVILAMLLQGGDAQGADFLLTFQDSEKPRSADCNLDLPIAETT